MRLVELFSGTGVLSETFRERGNEAVEVDIQKTERIHPDIQADVLELSPEDLPDDVDVVWASPPCTCFSRASMGHHWHEPGIPATDKCENHIKLVKHTVRLIYELQPRFWFLENPVGMIKYVLTPMQPEIISYCQFGHEDMKLTYLYGNHPYNMDYPRCNEGDGCHVAAPRGSSKAGTQSMDKDVVERARLPDGLCRAVVDACECPGGRKQQSLTEVRQQ